MKAWLEGLVTWETIWVTPPPFNNPRGGLVLYLHIREYAHTLIHTHTLCHMHEWACTHTPFQKMHLAISPSPPLALGYAYIYTLSLNNRICFSSPSDHQTWPVSILYSQRVWVHRKADLASTGLRQLHNRTKLSSELLGENPPVYSLTPLHNWSGTWLKIRCVVGRDMLSREMIIWLKLPIRMENHWDDSP